MKYIKIILTCLLALMILTSCSSNNTDSSNIQATNNSKTNTETTKNNDNDEEEVNKPQMDINNPIKEIHSVELKNEDEKISYKVPQINSSSYDALLINNEIVNKYSNIIINELLAINEDLSVVIYDIKWDCVKNKNNSIALIISNTYPDGSLAYNIYNFDCENEKRINNKEILKKARLTEEEFIKKAKYTAEKFYKEKYSSIVDSDNAMYKDRLAYTVSEERINIDMPMYINENNKISIVAEIGSLAGAESYYHIIELE